MAQLQPTDINKYIATIRINFENAYSTLTDTERGILIRTWYEILKDYPKEVCDRAVISAIKNAEFAPRIGSIVKEIEKMQTALEKPDGELWAELTAVLQEVARNARAFRFTYKEANGKTQGENARERVQEIFDGLSPELKDYIRTARGLIDMSKYTDEELAFERGRFLRIMPEIKQRAKTRQQMPESIAGMVQGLATQFTMQLNRGQE